MDLNRSVILQLRFGPLFWISFVPLIHDFHNGGQLGKNGNYNIRARPVRPQQNKHGHVSNVRHVASRRKWYSWRFTLRPKTLWIEKRGAKVLVEVCGWSTPSASSIEPSQGARLFSIHFTAICLAIFVSNLCARINSKILSYCLTDISPVTYPDSGWSTSLTKMPMFTKAEMNEHLVHRQMPKLLTLDVHLEGRVAKWSARRTCNPADQGSSPALATCWICARSSRVQILGHACK